MGRRAQEIRRQTQRRIQTGPLTDTERQLLESAQYEGSPYHKRNPGDFGLTPPARPRPDKTLCDEAAVNSKAAAEALFRAGIARGLVSEARTPSGFPKEFWVIDDEGNVFEAMYGGSQDGCYHGYPVRRNDPLFAEVVKRWSR